MASGYPQAWDQQQAPYNPAGMPQQQQAPYNPAGMPQQQQNPYNPAGMHQQQQQDYNNPAYNNQPAYQVPGAMASGMMGKNMMYGSGAYPGSPAADQGNTTSVPVDDGDDFCGFDDKSIRKAFIKKTFGILALQLTITVAICCLIRFIPEVRLYVATHNWVWIASTVVTWVFLIILACVKETARKWPRNIICLMLYTIGMATMVGSILVFYNADEILYAFGTVIIICFVMFILGFQQKFDLTPKIGALVLLTNCLFMFGLVGLLTNSGWAIAAYTFIGAVLFSVWLLVDIQMVVGGKHKVQFSEEEYIFAALNIYMDIINIFLFLLMIFGKRG